MNRPTRRPSTCRRFALRPVPLALAIAITASTLPARAGDSFTNVQQVIGATISNPNANTTNVNQTANNAYIQAGGFSIAAQDTVKIAQPGSTSNLLIQVTGYDPTAILGQLQANGRVFLSNPNGVLFGAGARIDVGSLVATNLSMDSEEFMRKRIRLFDNGNSRGSVVNAGSIKADGTVALVGTEVSNLGSIEASRVGMAALTNVVVDVEGDGLIFFQMEGERAGAKLQQLGSITADGGLVELRAQARGAVADTVLNMDGIIQARSIGSHNGTVIIDGGSSGITKVTGTVDVQGLAAGETGGMVKVLGDRVALGSTALIDASGNAGGGTVLVGGNYQGSGDERRASHTRVADGATIKANALTDGDGGTVVVWADGTTAFQGLIEAKGGAQGGNGGTVEVSGKQQLAFWGLVDTSAAKGTIGSLLLDPNNIFVISDAASPTGTLTTDFSDLDNAPTPTAGNYSVRASAINASVADITLVATNDITVNAAIDRSITAGASGKSLTLTAGNDINVNASIKTNDGNLTLTATSGSINLGANLDAGAASVILNSPIVLNSSVTITGGTLVHLLGTVESNNITGPFNLTVDAGSGGTAQFDGILGGGSNKRALNSLTVTGTALINTSAITTTGDQTYHGAVVVKTNTSLTATSGSVTLESTLDSQDSTARNVTLSATSGGEGVTLAGAVGSAFELGNLTVNGATAINGPSIKTTGNQLYNNAVTVGANTNLTSSAGDITFSSTLNASGADRAVVLSATSTGRKITLAGAVGGATPLGSITLSGTTLINTNTVTTSGNQTYNNAIKFGAHTTFTSSAGSIQFNSTLDSDAVGTMRSITLSAIAAGQGIIIGGEVGSTTALNSLSTNGATSINTSKITTNGDQTYNDAVTIGANTTLKANAGSVIFGATLDADTTARNVTLSATTTGEAVTLGGAVGATHTLGDLVLDGIAEINGGNAATAAVTANTQTYKNDVKLGGVGTTKSLVGNTLSFANGTNIKASTYALTLITDTLQLNSATSQGGGALTLAQRTASGSIGLDTSATENLNLSATDLTALGTFTSLTIGRTGSTSTVAFGTAYTLTRDTTLIGDTSVTLLGVTGGTHDLSLTSASSIFNGTVSGVSELRTSGATAVNANIGASTLIDFGGLATLDTGTAGTTRTLEATTVTLAGLAATNKNVVIKTNTLNLSGTLSSSGTNATVSTYTDGRAISLETTATAATNDLDIDAATLAKFGQFARLTIGRSDSNSAISTTTAITLPTNLTLLTGSGNITLDQVTGATFDLTANTTGAVTFNGNVAGVDELATLGAVTVNADISAAALISFGGTTTLGTGTAATTRTLDAATVTLAGLATGVKNIAIKADTLNLTGTVTSTGSQATVSTYTDGRAISLETTATAATTDLDITAATLAKFSQFSDLTIGRSDSNSAISTTTGITLPTATTLISGSGNITLAGVTGAGLNLAANTTGTVTFNGNVANVGSLTTLGATAVNANIGANTLIDFGGLTTLGTGTAGTTRTLEAQTVTLAGLAATDKNVTIKADTLNLSGAVTSSGGTATLATYTAGRAISLESTATVATTDLDIDAALLAKFGQFSSLTIGRSDSNSAISTTTAITLPTNLTLLTGSTGTISLAAITGGAFGLTLTAGGDTQLSGAFTNVASLTSNGGGKTIIGMDLSTATSMNFTGGENVVLAGAASALTLHSGAITLSGNLDAASKNLTLRADSLSLSGTISNAGNSATLVSDTRSLIRVGTSGSGSALDISTATLGKFSGFSQLNIGSTGFNASILTGAITLPTHTTFASGGGTIALGAITGAGFDLTTNSVGNTVSFQGNVAGVRDLATTGTPSSIVIDTASIATSRKQRYNADITLGTGSGARALSAPTIEITGSHTITAGAHDLSLSADALTMGGTITGSTGSDLTLATFTTSKTIGVLGGTGDLLVDSTLLAQTSGFDSITIGRSDSTATGTITLGDGTASIVTLPANLQLLSGAADIKVLNTVSSSGGTLGITSTTGNVLIAQDVGVSGANLASLSIATGGETTLQGVNIYAANATFEGDVVLDTNATTASDITYLTGGTYTFKDDIRGTGNGVQGLNSTNASLIKLQGNVGQAAATRLLSLYTHDAEVGGQLFATDFVALYGSTTLTADTRIEAVRTYIGSDNSTHTFTAGSHDLSIKTDLINVQLASVSGGDQWSLSTLTAGNQIRISTTGAGGGILLVDPNVLSQWGSFNHLTVGSADTGNITLDHSAATTLGADTTLLSGTGAVLIKSALQGAQALTIDAGGLTSVQADLGTAGNALSRVTITGKTEFAGGGTAVAVRTSGNQDYQDDVSVANATTLSTTAGDVRFHEAVDAKSGASATANLTIDTTGGNARFDAAVGSTTALNSLTTNAALVNGSGITTLGTQTYHGNVTLSSASTTLKGSTVTVDGAVIGTTTGAQALVVDGNAVLKGAVGTTGLRLASLQINNASTLSGGSIFTSGAQTYTGAVTLGANTTLTATSSNVLFSSTVNGDTAASRTLTINTAGTTSFNGAVGGTNSLASLVTDAAGTTELAATITTSGTQTYNDQVDVNGTAALTAGGNVGFLGAVNGKTAGAGALSINTSGETLFASTVGATRALGSLSTNVGGTTVLLGNVTTSGTISLLDAVTLGTDLTIAHGGLLTFGSTVDGAHELTLDGGVGNAAVAFNGAVGSSAALDSLTTVGTGAVSFLAGASGATTTGAQQYGGNVVLTGNDKAFTGTSLDFAGSLGGANGLTLTANALSLGSTLSGTGALLIQTLGAATTIGVGTGASGTLQIAQNLLNGTGGFSSLVIGRTDGTGAINVGSANLGTHTTLRSNTGAIALNGAVNSLGGTPVDLAISTGGAITLASDLGSTNALREISTSHSVSTPNAISIAAAKVTLQSTTNLTLNDLTLTGGGTSLIQTAQRLVLTGDINLSGGGTLGLVSTVAPTKVDVTDTEYASNNDSLTVGLTGSLREASAGIEQTGGKIVTAAGTTLYVRTTQGASIGLMQSGNDIQGGISAVSGRIGEATNTTRLTSADGSGEFTVGFVRIASKQINVLGQPVNDADQSLVAAGIEGDAVVLSADKINTSANDGLIRARLPYDNNQGTLTALPGLTLLLSSTGLNANQAYGGVLEADRIQVSVGNTIGGYISVRPKGGASLGPGFVSLGGITTSRPFYDGSGKVTEVPVFYNGDIPQTPQEVGALSAVTAVIEESRRQRFEEAVRTENVSARLRSGVIAEVGAGRPATEGSDSIRMPASCTPAGESLTCQ